MNNLEETDNFLEKDRTRDLTYIFLVFCIAGRFFTHEPSFIPRASLIAQLVKNLPALQETLV